MDTLNILKNLVGMPSIFPNEKIVARWIEKYLKKMGFPIKRQYVSTDRWNILAERGQSSQSILFYGHMDTVFEYGKWDTNPFALHKAGDRLFGLGACDMKGGISAILAAAKAIKTNKKIKILLGVDEENISAGVWKMAQEKREWFKDVKFVISGEPGASNKQIGGENMMTLGRRGRVVFSLTLAGKSYHGANPQKGVNAITDAACIAIALDNISLKKHPKLGKESLFVRKFEGQATSLSVPDRAYLEIDYHLTVNTAAGARKLLDNYIRRICKVNKIRSLPTLSIKERPTPYLEPYVIDPKNLYVQKVRNIIKDAFGEVIINYGQSVADDNILANSLGLPVIVIGPRGDNIHAANEWASKKSLLNLTGLYQKIIEVLT